MWFKTSQLLLQDPKLGTSLEVQWLRLHAPNEGDGGLIPGQRTKLTSAAQHGQNKDRLCPGTCPPIAHSPSKGSFPAIGLWWLFCTSQLCLPPCAMADWTKDRYPSCLSPLALITKYHRMGGLKNRNLFLILLEARKTKIKVPTASVPNALSLPAYGSSTSFLLHPHTRRQRLSALGFPETTTPSVPWLSDPSYP